MSNACVNFPSDVIDFFLGAASFSAFAHSAIFHFFMLFFIIIFFFFFISLPTRSDTHRHGRIMSTHTHTRATLYKSQFAVLCCHRPISLSPSPFWFRPTCQRSLLLLFLLLPNASVTNSSSSKRNFRLDHCVLLSSSSPYVALSTYACTTPAFCCYRQFLLVVRTSGVCVLLVSLVLFWLSALLNEINKFIARMLWQKIPIQIPISIS